ncbi:DUF6153 family protein [Mycobacterium sp. OTB74]|jgi:hypothetical protein|uniref:DUF6153 family protein n=1 Tax=Mycobacterium sp. OTB74 TaxID=1853452 RepID=UPI002473ED22|nr:DUF6153 family protein [Mycobacterium sp. OTB74]MDH6245206.1 hypothetical protein [Mycobacterium sp. OTB74]
MATHRTRLGFVGMLVLIAGIIGMHALIVAPAHSMAHAAPVTHYSAAMEPAHAGLPVANSADACDCNGHNGFHACVFIMTALLTIAGLALLYWVGVSVDARVLTRIRQSLRRRQRAPPWTVLTLAELALLRI